MTDIAASAELMDRIYRRQRHLYDFTRKYYLLGRDRLIHRLTPPAGSRVLEIGCGTARNLVVASRAYPDVHFFGIDISSEMLETARYVVEREGLAPFVRLARADATTFDPALQFGEQLEQVPGVICAEQEHPLREAAVFLPRDDLSVINVSEQRTQPGDLLRFGLVNPRV